MASGTFTKKHTEIAKGIAILLMVYHHLFVIPERIGGNYVSLLRFGSFDLENKIAVFAKLCVAIFLFLSGIGLYCSLEKETSLLAMYRKTLKKLLRFMINYWIIALLALPVGLATGFFQLDARTIFGLLTGNYAEINEWWFVCLYVLILLVAPLIVSVFQKNRLSRKVLAAVLLAAVFAAVWLFDRYGRLNPALTFIADYLHYLLSVFGVLAFVAGVFCARFDLYRFFLLYSRRATVLFNLLILAASVALRMILIKDPNSMRLDFIIAPLFVFSSAALLYPMKRLSAVPCFFSVHSTNIWLTHTLWAYYFATDIVVLPRYSTLIYLWLLALTLLTSIVINAIYHVVMKALFHLDTPIISPNADARLFHRRNIA